MAAPLEGQFSAWDDVLEKVLDAHLHRKTATREYGFLNYGDWFGERGRNWGNNEYDMPHGLFMQFARTGNRDFFRLALAGAQHQADVDCVHAYPDPFYVGANHQHSIGHTGQWSQVPTHATWSYRYDGHTAAMNGHTWADGMVNAWLLTGNPRIMEAALGIGEHITWAMAPAFNQLGSHERSAGWSLQAVMALYRATGDPVYLQAGRRIVEVPLREQNHEEGGAWPHVLPRDHSGGHQGARGNNLFLIGVLLSGMQTYHQATGDTDVADSLVTGVNWMLKSWDEAAAGWPYSASVDGEPFYRPTTSLNMLTIGPIAYAAHLTGNEQLIQVAERAFSAVTTGNMDSMGKTIGMQTFYAADIMANLQKWYEAHSPDRGIEVLADARLATAQFMTSIPPAPGFAVRGPDVKTFHVQLAGPQALLKAVRTPHGAMHKRAEFCTVSVVDDTGREIAREQYSTDGAHEFSHRLEGPAGSRFSVVIDDDMRGVWTVEGENLQVVAEVASDFRMGEVGRSRFFFYVPEGTTEFTFHLTGVHTGSYGGYVFTPDGSLAAFHQDVNVGGALVPGAPPGNQPWRGSERGSVTVNPRPEDTGKVWSVVLAAAGNIDVVMTGVPPYLALSPESWFDPRQ